MAQTVEKLNLAVLGGKEIIDLMLERKKLYRDRDGLYEVYQKYYRGKQGAVGPSVLAANSQGRPLLRVSESGGNQDRSYSSQRLAPIVDDNQALLGRMPSVRVEPPDPSSAGIDRGELLTKYLISTHELSQMDRQQAEMGYYLPCLGDGCYVLEVEPELRRVVWTVADPSTCYPTFMSGYRRYDVMDLIIHYLLDPYAAKARWGKRYDTEEQRLVPVTIYLSKHQRTTVVGIEEPDLVQHLEWNLKFCPAVWVFNKLNGQMANSDIAQSLVSQDALDFLWSLFLEGATQNTYPIIGIRNPLSLSGDPIQVGPGAPPVQLGPDGQITVTNSQGSLDSVTFGMQSLIAEINVAAGTTQVRQEGTMHSSLPTGRAMHAMQGPQATRVELKQTELGAAIRRANEMTLEMQEKAPLLGDHEFEIFGRFKGTSFLHKMSGQEIDGWYRNSVYWDPVTGMNQQQKTAVAYEAKAAGLVDSVRAMEMTGEDDPEGMLQRVRREREEDAHQQARLQGMLQPQGTPGPAGGGAPAASPQAPAGPTSEPGQPAPTRIARPPGMGADKAAMPLPSSGQPGQPGQQAPTQESIEQALKLVGPRLKGSVALVINQTRIQLLVADHRDVPRVMPIIRAIDPQATVKVVKEADWPETATRVA